MRRDIDKENTERRKRNPGDPALRTGLLIEHIETGWYAAYDGIITSGRAVCCGLPLSETLAKLAEEDPIVSGLLLQAGRVLRDPAVTKNYPDPAKLLRQTKKS